MISTGCDIVALDAIDAARTRQQNFYSKIITPAESELYDNSFSDSISMEVFVWLAWSVKESAYKFLQRLTPNLTFSPSKIILEQVSSPPFPLIVLPGGTHQTGFDNQSVYSGTISLGEQVLHFRSLITADFIFSVVDLSGDFKDTYWGVRDVDSTEPEQQSTSVREFILEQLDNLFSGGDITIQKSPNGYPIVLQNDAELPVAASFTHHNHWVAYSFIKTE